MSEHSDAIDAAQLERRIGVLEDTLNLYRQNGLDQLLTRSLNYHALPYVDTIPTRNDRSGTPEIVATGGVRYLYVRTTVGWERVALA